MSLDQTIVKHYEHGSLEKALLAAVAATGKDADGTLLHSDLSAFDEFHIGGRKATVELSSQIELPRGAHVLDVGSGLGGPSRYFAAERGWTIDGIDLTPEYVEVARTLSQRAGLSNKVGYRVANAARLPFADASFDGAYMLHVGMNIPDKRQAFAEVRRVLKPGGLFAIYDCMLESDAAFTYPVPWSSEPATNHIDTAEHYKAFLRATGFKLAAERNRRDFAIQAFQQRTGLSVVMGAAAAQKAGNMRAQVESGVFAPVELIARAG
jgi:ubiquinone/menaquinone biosynthesis C-methylase UbiE